VLDIDCDLPPGFAVAALEDASYAQFRDHYPKRRTQFIQECKIEMKPDVPVSMSARPAIQAFQFAQEDERQLVQVRAEGFSFNRLSPYTSLDDYLPEIERTWRLYVDLVSPVQIRLIRLRYINRILVPLTAGMVDLDEFLKVGPRLPDEETLLLSGFLSQQFAIEKHTGHQLNLVLTPQPRTDDKLPIILDITVGSGAVGDSTDWSNVLPTIQSLRSLKNRTFANTLTEKCIELFQS
jgi:uncharacterized protein (TIGR04255 family)